MKDWTEFGLRPLPVMSARSRVVEVPPIQGAIDALYADCRAELSVPVRGITTNGKVAPGLFGLQRGSVDAAPIRDAALAFLQSLTESQRSTVVFPLDADERRDWFNVHMNFFRHGVMLENLPMQQRQLGLDMLRATLSADWSGSAIVESVSADWSAISTEQIYHPCSEAAVKSFQQGIVIANADIYSAEIDDLHLQLLESVQIMANLVVPIFKGTDLWGLLIAHHCSAPRQWQPSEIDLVKQLASQVSIAIQQANLFAQAQLELTHRKQAEMTLQLLNAEIDQRQSVETLKDEFIGIVSHELRTPLTSMQGALGLLAMGLMDDEPEQMKRMIEIASIETERLVRLVNNILDLDKLDASSNSLELEWCDANLLAQTAIDVMIGSAAAAGVDLELNCQIGQIFVVPDRIVQTLTNLIGNAIKFSPPNTTVSIEVTEIDPLLDRATKFDSVRTDPATRSRRVRFAIADCGRGIPADKLETIFNRFQQVDSSDSRDKGGTGLGLAICKSIVEQHQGQIWVESDWGHNSTFFFTLPQPMHRNSQSLGTLER